MKPIDPQFIINGEKLRTALTALEDQITDRITYIINYCFENVDTWYFDGAAEGSIGDLWSNIECDEIEATIISTYRNQNAASLGRDTIIIDYGGNERNLYDSFPKRWLFENFEEEFTLGKIKYQAKKLEKLNKQITKETKIKDLAKTALKKLSKEEIKAIKDSLK